MDDVLYERVYRLQVDTLLITGLRITFAADLTSGDDPNKSSVTVYNLNEDTRARLSGMKSALVTLEAGYPSNMAVIFSGDTRRDASGIVHSKNGPDWLTRLECGDGETALRTKRFVGSFAKGTPVVDVAKALASSLGVGLGNLDETLRKGGFRQGLQSFPSGYAVKGRSGEELFRLLKTLGMEASIQNGKLQVLKPNETLNGKAVLLTPDTGLVGSPAFNSAEGKDKGSEPPTLKVTSLLQPAIRPGVQLRVEARSVRGAFKVKAVRHAGDSHGGTWTSECTCVPV